MPKSFDISRKPKRNPLATPAASHPTPKRRNKGGLVFILFIIAIGAIGYSFTKMSPKYLVKKVATIKKSNQSDKPKPSATPDDKVVISKSPDDTTTTKPPETTTATNKIQILNGTGIETSAPQVKKILEDNKLTVESVSKAQFEYGQTYIYYRPNSVETAKQISKLLSVYKPNLSESQISGLFDILIIIGKDNLPPT